MDEILVASAVVQAYGRNVVVSAVDLTVRAGRLGILGPNGAGKTTLLRVLATVAPPRSGTLRIDGIDVTSGTRIRSARRRIGYLPQHFGFYPAFTVLEFVRYCAWLREVPSAEIDERARWAVEAVGLGRAADTKLKKLSGGMLRRCGIAQAIVGRPRLLLLDEPTVGLDPEQRLEFRELIRSLEGMAVVLSTHLVEDVAAVCDEVVVMDRGRIRFTGSPADLVSRATTGARGDTPLERGYTAVLADGGTR